jgi:hypothetical protein
LRTISDGTVAGNLPKVSYRYWAWRLTQALNSGEWTWALPRTDVVVDDVAVLEQEAEPGDAVLGDVGHRDDQQRAGHVHAPGVWPSMYGSWGRQVQAPVRQPAQPPPVALQHELEGDLLLGRVDQGAGVPGGEEPGAVVGEEQLGTSSTMRGCGQGRHRQAATTLKERRQDGGHYMASLQAGQTALVR